MAFEFGDEPEISSIKHDWKPIDKSVSTHTNKKSKQKKKIVPPNLTCFLCKKKGDHWHMDCPLKKAKTKNQDNDVKENSSQQMVGVVVIGDTGTGKSSIIKLLSGEDTKISHDATRGTGETSIIPSKYDENICFIDTVGLRDQDVNWKDTKLLKKTLEYLHFNKLDCIKIIFCVAGDTNTREGLFDEIARFIASLKVDKMDTQDTNMITDTIGDDNFDDKDNVWNSVLIIKKGGVRGMDSEKISNFSGVFAAATSNNAPDQFKRKNHIFGFTCPTWLTDKEKDDIFFKEYGYCKKYGYYTEENAKNIIEDKLAGLPPYTLKFRHERCSKCNAEGDPRYKIAPCHTTSEKKHTKPLSSKHTGKMQYKHSGQVIEFRFSTSSKYHDGIKRFEHTPMSEVAYHPGEIQKVRALRIVAGIFSLSITEWAKWNWGEWWRYYDCCNKYVEKAGAGCKYKWRCCGKDEENDKCSKPENRQWSCCEQPWESEGCKNKMAKGKMYNCCKREIGSIGCEPSGYYCCGKLGEGCEYFYPCCKKGIYEDGCQEMCANCKKRWGTGAGCLAPQN